MREIHNLFKLEDTVLLSSLIGQEFLYVGGPEVPDYLVSDVIVLGASNSPLTISADIANFALGDGSEDISFMSISSNVMDSVIETEKSGRIFLSNYRSQITGVSLVRETATYNVPDELAWVLISDVAFVLHLLGGHIIFRKVSQSVEAISVTYSNDFFGTEFGKTSSRYAFSKTNREIINFN